MDICVSVLECSVTLPDARAIHANITDRYGGDVKEIEFDDYILLKDAKQTDVIFGRYQTDGSMAFVEYVNGQISSVILRNGSYIQDIHSGEKIITLNKKTKDIGVSFKDESIKIACTQKDIKVMFLNANRIEE